MKLTAPKLDSVRTPLPLLESAYRLWALSDYAHVPNPAEVLQLPAGYVNDLITYAETVKFFEDAGKRPAEMTGGRRNKKREAETPG